MRSCFHLAMCRFAHDARDAWTRVTTADRRTQKEKRERGANARDARERHAMHRWTSRSMGWFARDSCLAGIAFHESRARAMRIALHSMRRRAEDKGTSA